MHQLPPEAIAALAQGRLIEAIKIVRDQSGLDLKSAKEAVERYANETSGMPDRVGSADGELSAVPSAARAALARGDKLEAIRLTREATGLGLAESKNLIEGAPNLVASGFEGLTSGAPTNAQMNPMVEPGRVQGRGLKSVPLVTVLLLLVVLAWWYFGKGA